MQNKGFTMIELLVVVIIMATLTAIMMPQYRRVVDRAKVAEAVQVLPAVFEARERWVLEHGCQWASGESPLSCADGATLTFPKLDIEVNATSVGADGLSFSTEYFTYYLVTNETPAGSAQRCVAAVPNWGSSLGLPDTTIYYRGDKFSCARATSSEKNGCALLNVDDGDGNGSCR